MVQEQLVGYISSQMKLGVSREAIKSALVGAGWAAADVEDTLKKIDGGASKPAAPVSTAPTSAATPGSMAVFGAASSRTASTPASVSPSMMSGGMSKSAEPQSIRVSDLVSGGANVTPATVSTLGAMKNEKSEQKKPPEMAMEAEKKAPRAGHIMTIVWIIIVLALAGGAGFLYYQNSGLAGKTVSLGNESADLTSRITSLSTQVQGLDASNTALAAQVASLTKDNADLEANLSFLVASPSANTTGSETVSVSGTLAQKKSAYVLTTAYGVAISVKNGADALVAAALKPLLGGTSPVELTGTYVPGLPSITVTAVNGSPISAVITTATTTATSSPSQ